MTEDLTEDFSCGVIPYRDVNGTREFLLIRHKAGHWAFPKGHPEDAEDHAQTARRELEEETGLGRVELDEAHPFNESYVFIKRSGKRVRKVVVYFVGRVDAVQSVRMQASEVTDFAWGDAEATRALMTFDEGKALLDEVAGYLDGSSGA